MSIEIIIIKSIESREDSRYFHELRNIRDEILRGKCYYLDKIFQRNSFIHTPEKEII